MRLSTRTAPTLLVSLALILPGIRVGAEGGAEGSSPPATRAYVSGTREAVLPHQESPATPTVETLHAALLAIMRSSDELGYNGRCDRISSVVAETFDLPFMAAKSMGRHWKKLPEADQGRWLEIFASHVSANYAGQFTGFSGETFETLGEESARSETLLVRTQLVDPTDENVELSYRLRQVPEGWKIIDVYMDGTVSELALRRSEFSSVAKREGFDALIETLNAKITKLASGE